MVLWGGGEGSGLRGAGGVSGLLEAACNSRLYSTASPRPAQADITSEPQFRSTMTVRDADLHSSVLISTPAGAPAFAPVEIDSFLALVEKPQRYIGGERNAR